VDPAVEAYLRHHHEDFLGPLDRGEDFTLDELDKVIGILKDTAASGPDTVSSSFIKNGGLPFKLSLLHVVNISWRTGSVPRLWKAANVRPQLKDRHKPSSPGNFRPISLLSVVGKIAERLVHARLTHLLESRGVLPPAQSGFRRHRSVMDCLTSFATAMHETLESKQVAAAAFVDLEKAYDTVWRPKLLAKLHHLGVRGQLLAWLSNFLSDRVQRVCLSNGESDFMLLEDGLPQGAVLSCTLFIVYAIDALDERWPTQCAFADDLLVWSTGSTAQEALRALQERLDSLSRWAASALCHVSSVKSAITLFSRPGHAGELAEVYRAQPVLLAGQPLPYEPKPKYLGVTFASDLSWNGHIALALEKATRMSLCIRKLVYKLSARGAPAGVILQLYRSLVLPHLTYACPIWCGAPERTVAPLISVERDMLLLASGALAQVTTAALSIDLHLLPLDLRWKLIALRWEARILRLSDDHPLRRHWIANILPAQTGAPGALMNRRLRSGLSLPQRLVEYHRQLGRLAFELPELVEPLDLAPIRPAVLPELSKCPAPRDQAATWLAEELARLRALDIPVAIAFTDGSATPGKPAASAFSLFSRPGLNFWVARATAFPPDRPCAAYGAELMAICMALREMVRGLRDAVVRHDRNQLHIFSDCLTAVLVLTGSSTPDSYVSLCNTAWQFVSDLHDLNCVVTLHWIPGHAGIAGNDEVDLFAKGAADLPPSSWAAPLTSAYLVPHSAAVMKSRQLVFSLWADEWRRMYQFSCVNLRKLKPVPTPALHCWSSDRARDTVLCRLRLGLILNGHMHRIKLAVSPRCPAGCVDFESVEHFLLHCPVYSAERSALAFGVRQLLPDCVLDVELLLGSSAPALIRTSILSLVYQFYLRCNR
jgi:ribonuclease HI